VIRGVFAVVLGALVSGCGAYRLGQPDVPYARPEPLPLVRTTTDPRWYVPIQVEGAEGDGLWAFFVDTGYSYTTCDDDLIAALGLETRGRTTVRGELGKLTTTKAKLPPIQLGGHLLEGLTCQVRDMDSTSSIRDNSEVPIAGVLGMDVLRPFTVRMDPQQGEIHLWDPETVPPIERKDANAVRLRRENRLGIRAVVPVTIADQTLWPVLDTGATGTHIDGAKLGLTPSRVREGVEVRGTGASGSAVRTIAYYEVTDFDLGGHTPGRVVIAGREGGVGAGLLGLNVLSRYIATYDFDRGAATFEPIRPRRLRTWSEWRSAYYPPQATRILERVPDEGRGGGARASDQR
jgi:predicted aspartyl protease